MHGYLWEYHVHINPQALVIVVIWKQYSIQSSPVSLLCLVHREIAEIYEGGKGLLATDRKCQSVGFLKCFLYKKQKTRIHDLHREKYKRSERSCVTTLHNSEWMLLAEFFSFTLFFSFFFLTALICKRFYLVPLCLWHKLIFKTSFPYMEGPFSAATAF